MVPETQPLLDIIVPTCRPPDQISRLLDSLRHAPRPAGLGSVIVVENGEPKGVETVCQQTAAVLPIHYDHEPKPGRSFALNRGIDVSTARYVLFLDDDVYVEGQTLESYVSAFASWGESAFFGGPVAPKYERPPADWLTAFLPDSAKGFCLCADESEEPVNEPAFLGGNLVVPRRALALEGFDAVSVTEGQGGMGEETRLQAGLLERGYRGVYVASARVWHEVPAANCTPEWALNRLYRWGLTQGLMAEPSPEYRLFGAPFWVWRRYLGAYLHRVLGRLAGDGRDERFNQAARIRELAGVIEGYRQQTVEGEDHG